MYNYHIVTYNYNVFYSYMLITYTDLQLLHIVTYNCNIQLLTVITYSYLQLLHSVT